MDRKQYWEGVYSTKSTKEVSWFQGKRPMKYRLFCYK